MLAITPANAFAEFLGHALETKRPMTRQSWRSAWIHNTPTLAAANVPTALFLAAWLGWIVPQTAFFASQAFCVALLALLGARAGWVLDHRVVSAILGALFVGGVRILLSVLKFVIHQLQKLTHPLTVSSATGFCLQQQVRSARQPAFLRSEAVADRRQQQGYRYGKGVRSGFRCAGR